MSTLALLFDLDGTLTDPQPGIVRCMRYALDKLGTPYPPDDVLASFIGPSLRGTFATLLETSDQELVERAVALYREQYGDTGLFENDVYDGVGPMLDDVSRLASAMFVATLKPTVYAERIVHRLGLARHLAGVYGTQDRASGPPAGGRTDLGRARGHDRRPGGRHRRGPGQWRPIDRRPLGLRVSSRAVDARADGLCLSPGDLAACLSQIAI